LACSPARASPHGSAPLAGLIPAATPPAAPAYPAGGPGLPAATRELIDILAAMTLVPAR
jgi:hypothetical protein